MGSMETYVVETFRRVLGRHRLNVSHAPARRVRINRARSIHMPVSMAARRASSVEMWNRDDNATRLARRWNRSPSPRRGSLNHRRIVSPRLSSSRSSLCDLEDHFFLFFIIFFFFSYQVSRGRIFQTRDYV